MYVSERRTPHVLDQAKRMANRPTVLAKPICMTNAGAASAPLATAVGVGLARGSTYEALASGEAAVAATVADDVVEELDGFKILNTEDCARIVVNESVSGTRLTRKPSPTGQPPLGGLATMVPKSPSTRAASTWLSMGITLGSWLVKTAVKLRGSVAFLPTHVKLFGPVIVQSCEVFGTVTWYARASTENERKTPVVARIVGL